MKRSKNLQLRTENIRRTLTHKHKKLKILKHKNKKHKNLKVEINHIKQVNVNYINTYTNQNLYGKRTNKR